MYSLADVEALFKMIETGTLKIGPDGGSEIISKHKLEGFKNAWEDAAEHSMFGQQVVITP